ncbi:hypothetical protein MuYL_3997 [Mucilaginibacter xinganensis]|uniref:Uncharacterized protein n=1 Tax=Mucilaginibacter xinganensis TaxID=1234841 RepID=A0A223P191_9SPHI|nr:hypothetical protein MuYL_3997 [Mucilaginibacter xinganensis]
MGVVISPYAMYQNNRETSPFNFDKKPDTIYCYKCHIVNDRLYLCRKDTPTEN